MQIRLSSTLELSDRRFRERYVRGERHPAHVDEAAAAYEGLPWEKGWERWSRPLDLGVPTLSIDTGTGYVQDLTDVLAFIRSACG